MIATPAYSDPLRDSGKHEHVSARCWDAVVRSETIGRGKTRQQPADLGSLSDKSSWSRLLIIIPILISLCGCIRHYIPISTFPFEPIDEFSSTNSVSLQNGQPSTKQVTVFSTPIARFYGNLNTWTDVAIKITSHELTTRGLTVSNEAPKTITMSIQSADNENGAVQLSYKIVMQVETSDGYSATYVGDNTSYVMAVPPRQINGTMMRVVHEMLMDKNIVDFLTK